MNKVYKNEQSGRSMVEMLGVLAIIGVLSVGGIAGYSKAMAKFKTSKAMDQISMLVANIRTLYSGQRSYTGLTNATANSFGIVSSDMSGGVDTAIITNAFGGTVTVAASAAPGLSFSVQFQGMGREQCVALSTADWGSGSGSGLVSVGPSATEAVGGAITGANLPVTLAAAAAACTCATDVCSITWVYN